MEKRLPLAVGTVLQGRYRIIRQLGHGGFGAVYEAVDDEIGKSFALKETFYAADEELRQAFKREARMLASLEHDAFPIVSHYFTENDGCFLVMELIRGDDLDHLLNKRTTPFEEPEVLLWADQILDALEDLHSNGIIHRDIKPSNLKLTPKGKIKLLDFGIAKGAVEGETKVLTTVGSLAAATLQYAPLEQVLKASLQCQMMLSVVSSEKVLEISHHGTHAASDLYALAATLYHLLTKKLPADAATRALAIWSGQTDQLIPAHEINPQISIKVSEALQRAMMIDYRERIASATHLRQLLNEVKGNERKELENPPPVVPKPFYQPETPIQPAPTEPSPKVLKTAEVLSLPEPVTAAKKSKKNVMIAALIGGLLLIIGLSIFIGLVYWKSKSAANPVKTVDYSKLELLATLTGHKNKVYKVAFSPNGKILASVSEDRTIKLWDTADGLLKQTLPEKGSVRAVTFSPDGKTLVSGSNSDDGQVKLWDVEGGNFKRTFNGFPGVVVSVAFSPDGKILASGGYDNTIRLWDLASDTLKLNLTGSGIWVSSIAFSPDGKTLASGNNDKTIKLWDVESGKLKQTLTGDSDWVSSVAFSPDGKTLVSGHQQTIKLWDLESGNLKQTLTQTGNVQVVTFSPDGKTLASGSNDNTIKLWDASDGSLKQTLTGHKDIVESVAFSLDGKMLASGSDDTTVKLWRLME